MPKITIQEMEQKVAALVEAVHRKGVEYEIVDQGVSLAILMPVVSDAKSAEPGSDAEVLALLESWRTEEIQDDEPPLEDLLDFLEQHRLDLRTAEE